MNLRKHSHPAYMQWFKNIFSILGFLYPVYIIIILAQNHLFSFISIIFHALFGMICTLVPAYFFQDVWVDEEGLMVDFLWRKLRIPWSKVIQVKPLFGIKRKKQTINVVMVNGLTPFHRLYGLIYGFSLKPAFILWPTVSNYEVLKNDIEKHIKQNRKPIHKFRNSHALTKIC